MSERKVLNVSSFKVFTLSLLENVYYEFLELILLKDLEVNTSFALFLVIPS